MFLCHDGFMADNEFEIKAKLTADTKGAKEATQALKEVKKSVDEVTQSTNHTTGDDTFERYAKSAQKAKSQFLELKAALKAMREELSAMGDDPYAKANLGTIADFEKLMPQKSAFSSQNVVELDEATRKVKELTQAFDQLMDTGRQMTVDPSAEVEKVIKAHEKRIDAAEKAYDREEKASAKAAAKSAADEEQKRLAAEKYFSSYMNGQKRIAATLQELQAEYGKYIQKLNEARAAGDRDGAKDAIANLRQLKSQMASVERQAEMNNRRMAVMTRRFTGMATGALNAASALSGLNGTMGTLSRGLSNIASGAVFGGAWGAAFGAATVGIEALVNKLNEQTKMLNAELKVTDDRLQSVISKYSDLTSKNVLDAYNRRQTEMIEAQTNAYKAQTDEIERMYRWKLNLNQLEKGEIDSEAARKKAENEYEYQAGNMSKTELALRNLEIDKDARARIQGVNRQGIIDEIKKARDNYLKEQDALDKAVANEEKASSNLLNSTEYVKVVKGYEADANRIASNRRDLDLTEKRLANLEDTISSVKEDPSKNLLKIALASDLGEIGISEKDRKEIFDQNLGYKDIIANMEKFANDKLKGEIKQRQEWDKKMQESNKAREESIKAMLEKLTAQGLLTPEETYIGVMPGDTAEEREKERLARYEKVIGLLADRMEKTKTVHDEAVKARKSQEEKTNSASNTIVENEYKLEEFDQLLKSENEAFDAQAKAMEATILRQDDIEKEQRRFDQEIDSLKKVKKEFEEQKKKAEKRFKQAEKRGTNALANETLDDDILNLSKTARNQIGNSDSSLSKLLAALREKGNDGRIDAQEQAELNNMLKEWTQEFTGGKEATRAQSKAINQIISIIRKFVALTNDSKGEIDKEVEACEQRIEDCEKEIERLNREKNKIGKDGWKPRSLQPSQQSGFTRPTQRKNEERDPLELQNIRTPGPTRIEEIKNQTVQKIDSQPQIDTSEIVSSVMNMGNTVVQKFIDLQTSSQDALNSAGSRIAYLDDALSKLDTKVKYVEDTAKKADRTATQLMNWKKFNSRI